MKISFIAAESNVMTWVFVALLVVLVVALLVVPMFTNKKRAKQTMDLHNSLRPGDVIKTVGGIIGTIKEVRQVSPNEKEMLIETGDGDNKTTMWFDIQALYQVMSRAETPAVAAPADTATDNGAAIEEPVKDEQPAAAEEPATPHEPNKDAVDDALVAEAPASESAAVEDVKPEASELVPEVETAEAAPAAEDAAASDVAPAPKKTTAKPKSATPAKKKPVASKNTSTKK